MFGKLSIGSERMRPEPLPKLTLKEVFLDLGWFSWIFALVVAGPSVLSILQAVFVDHRLIAAFQWIVDGYNGILAVLGAIFEPLITPAIELLNRAFDWDLTLRPHWRPLMVLCAMATIGHARALWGSGNRSFSVWFGISATIAAFFGAISAGVLPADGLVSTLVGVFPATVLAFVFSALMWLGVSERDRDASTALTAVSIPFVVAVAMFSLSAIVVAAEPALTASTVAVASLAVLIFAIALMLLWVGIGTDQLPIARTALTVLGGFVVAAAVLLADQIVKAIA